jgi:predicted RNase H-like HicB family nuclease
MRYAIAIEPGNEKSTWGVVVPDLPVFVSAIALDIFLVLLAKD